MYLKLVLYREKFLSISCFKINSDFILCFIPMSIMSWLDQNNKCDDVNVEQLVLSRHT